MKRQRPEDPKPPCYVSYASSIDLSEDELKYFHKPRVSLVGEMKGVFQTAEDDDTFVVEYYEQRPPLHLLEGMTSTIVADDIMRMENTLFRAPMFARDRLSCCDSAKDYLMMIYDNTFVIQPLPSTIYLCGQLEPRCVVPFPKVESLSGKSQVMNSQSKLLALGIAKYFNRLSASTGASASAVSFATVLNAILSDYSQKSVHRESVRKEFKRLVHRIALKDADLSQQQPQPQQQPQYVQRPRDQREPHFSVQHLMTSCLVPEDVCAVQSCLAYEYYLRECCGINMMLRLEQVESWLDGMQRLRKYKEERAMQILATSTSSATLVRKLAQEIVRLDRRIDAGLFVYREMLNAPWNTTATFLECAGAVEMDIMHPMRRDPLLLAYFPWRRRRSVAKDKLNLRISFQEALKMLNMKMSSPELDPFRPAATKKSDFFDQRGALNYLREKIRKQFEEQKAAPSATFQETMIRMQTQQARALSDGGAAIPPPPPPFQFMRAPEEEEAISNVFQEIERKVNENEKLLLQSLRAAPAPPAPLCKELVEAEAGYAIRKTIRRVNRKTGEETVTFEFRACTFTDMRVLYLRTKKP